MTMIPSALLLIQLALPTALSAQSQMEAPAPSAAAPDKEARLKQLAELLKSFSDDDYQLALSQVPSAGKNQQLVSRGAVLKSVYNSLAAYEYEQAGRKVEASAAAGGVQEAGQATDVLKWLANATLNYWLKGGQTYVGREIRTDSPSAKLDQSLASLETKLAESGLPAEKKSDLHLEKAKLYEQLAAAPLPGESEDDRVARKAERIEKLADLLQSVTDEDYQEALKTLPADSSASKSKLATRAQVLRSSYLSLAALEYRRDAKTAGSPSSKAYDRLVKDNASDLVVDPQTLQETGWAMDLAKWLGNAALNYWLHGGEDFANRGFEPGGGKPEKTVESGETEVSATLDHYQRGQAFEQMAAAAAAPVNDEEKARVKKERLKRLAELLQSVSEEDYQDTLALIPEDSPARPYLASRGKVLKSAYVTLAALEYNDAARKAPQQASAPYTRSLDRLSRDERDHLMVQPQTLQETGWGKKLLGIAAMGGIGYAVYRNQEALGIRPRRAPQSPPRSASTQPDVDKPSDKTKPPCQEILGCNGVRSSKCPTDGSVEIVTIAAQCPKPPTCPGPQCESRDEACPKGRLDNDSTCSNRCSKGKIFIDGECLPFTRPLRCEGPVTLPSGIPFCHNTICAEGQQAFGAVCFAKKSAPRQQCPPGYVWGKDPLWMPAPIPPCRQQMTAESCANYTEAYRKHNRNEPRCVKQDTLPIGPRGPRMRCQAFIPACGYPELKTNPIDDGRIRASAKIGDLYGELEAQEGRLSDAAFRDEERAKTHAAMGALYEQLASLSDPAPAAPTPAPPATPEAQSPAPAEQIQEPPQPKSKSSPRAQRPPPESKEDVIQREMKDMDDMEKKMKKEIERRGAGE